MPSITIGDPIPVGWSGAKFNLVCAADGNRALDAKGPDNGGNAHTWDYSETNDWQVWELKVIDINANLWTLRNPKSDHFLDLAGGNADNGADVRMYSRNGPKDLARHNQEWFTYLVNGSGGNARIALQNVMSGTFLNLDGGAPPENGTRVQGYQWDASLNCVWRLIQQL